MLEMFSYEFVWLAIVCALILAGIHAYLGFHIVSRGVIFVDLSLAQVAALGAVSAPMLGVEEGSISHYGVSLLFTLFGAWIVSVAKTSDDRIPQEAFIGILYAGGAALTVLLLARRPGGMEELQHMLAGSLMTVTPREIGLLAATYAIIGFVHYRLRDRFFFLTEDRKAAVEKGWNTTWWDFLFYATFGIVVTSAVLVAGVLMVFSLLVIPPVIALLLTRRPLSRLVVGWVFALVGSIGGILASVGLNLPTGPSIITFLILLLVTTSLVSNLSRRGA